MQFNGNQVKMIKEMYPKGTRIELVSMDDPYTKLKSGDMGTIDMVDDIGTIHMNWDNGSTLGLVYGEDSFKKVIEPEQDMSGAELSM